MRREQKLRPRRWLWSGLLLAVVCVGLYQVLTLERSEIPIPGFIQFLVEPGAHPFWYFLLLAVLPVVGFPISVFCVLAGMKFGLGTGVLVIGVAMALHLLLAYWLGHSFLRRPLHDWLERRGYQPARVPEHHQLRYAITFVAIPVIPYAVKNYLLAMSHLKLGYYLGVAWTIQMLYSLPLIAMTGAVRDQNPVILLGALTGLVLVYLVSRRARRASSEQGTVEESTGPGT